MHLRSKIILASLVIALATVSVAQEREKKIKRALLPAAVEKTVKEQSEGATIKGFASEMDKGAKVYELSMTINGHNKDILIDSTGNVIEVEEQVTMDSLPQPVKDALTKAAGRGTINMIESLTKNGTLVAYEGHVKRGLKRFEIQVGPNGEKLAHPE